MLTEYASLSWDSERKRQSGQDGRACLFFFVKIIWKQNIEVPISNKFIIAGSGFYKVQKIFFTIPGLLYSEMNDINI